MCEESLILYRGENDLAGMAGACKRFLLVLAAGDPERAFALGKEALDLGLTRDAVPNYQATYLLGAASWFQGDFAQAEEFGKRALALSREEGDDRVDRRRT